jgi:two-component system, NtrC family, nitrogen regulation response regulator NtrX
LRFPEVKGSSPGLGSVCLLAHGGAERPTVRALFKPELMPYPGAMARVLIVDDETAIRDALRGILERQGYVVSEAANAGSAIALLDSAAVPDAALVDLLLPDKEGTAVLEAVRKRGLPTAVVMISGHGSIPAAVASVRAGAFDFLEKPLDRERLLITLRNATRQGSLARRASETSQVRLFTDSPLLRRLLDEAKRVAVSPAPVLITGETGCGKEVLARWIHEQSPAASGPFVALNCAALPENLAESELFGHVKGAFTGAEATRKGKFVTADGGTLFLDEIGDLPLPVQAKLLRVLEEATVEAVGADRSVPVRVRVIAATHRDLKARAKEGTFREDLLFRISGLPLAVPPLRERPEDIVLLSSHFMEESRARQGWPPEPMKPAFLEALKRYAWPGNVRELRWAVERAVLLAGPDLPGPEHLPPEISGGRQEGVGTLFAAREVAEEKAIEQALERASGNVASAARLLNLSRSRLYERLAKLHIDPTVYRKKKS